MDMLVRWGNENQWVCAVSGSCDLKKKEKKKKEEHLLTVER